MNASSLAAPDFRKYESEHLMRRIEREELPLNLAAFLSALRRYGDRPAAVFFDDNETLTYAALLDQVSRLASSFERLHIARGTHVGVMLHTDTRYPLTWLALATIGAVAVPINPAYTARELRYVIATANVRFLVIDSGLLPVFLEQDDGAVPGANVITVGSSSPDVGQAWETLLAEGVETFSPSQDADRDDLMNIQYTSGTTGMPKGAMLSQRYWLTIARVGSAQLQDSVSRILIAQPFYYIDAQWMFLMALGRGGTAFIARRQSATRFFGWVRELGVEFCNFPELVAKQPEQASDRDNRLRVIYCYSHRAETYARYEERYGCLARQGFSMTETGIVMYVPMEANHMTGTRTVGIPAAFREVMIADKSGREVESGAVGEICVRGPGMFSGYHGMPEATRDAFWPGGWFRTGDLGRCSEDRWFYYLGRQKDMVKRSGENISAMEVETVLRGIPEILEAAVIAVPDEVRGEEAKAYVLPRPGITPLELPPEAILAYCARHLARFKIPRYIEYVDEFPRTPSRKIKKAALVAGKADQRIGAFDAVDGLWRW
jgi:acyl-CoA synthetase (AMP-forming)/AMP-acid ligase II